MRFLIVILTVVSTLPGCSAKIGPECEGLSRHVGYDLPVTPIELEKIRVRGFTECAAYIEKNSLVKT